MQLILDLDPKRIIAGMESPGVLLVFLPGNLSGFGAIHHLCQTLVPLNVPVMAQPEAYIGGVAGLFDEGGELTNESATGFLKSFMDSYATWVERKCLRGSCIVYCGHGLPKRRLAKDVKFQVDLEVDNGFSCLVNASQFIIFYHSQNKRSNHPPARENTGNGLQKKFCHFLTRQEISGTGTTCHK